MAHQARAKKAQENVKYISDYNNVLQRPSRYIEQMVLHTERRQREQNAAWEKMEKKDRQREVETGQADGNAESFVTDAYRQQMLLNTEAQMVTKIEEQINESKTANAQTGMMGFYKNLLTKNKAINETPQQQQQMTAREKIEDKLAQLKERQEKKREEERR